MQPLALYVPPGVRRLLRRLASRGPHNLARRGLRALSVDLDNALNSIVSAERAIDGAGLDYLGLRILEIGPGHHFGPQLLLASRGAQVTLADRFLAPWDPDYHPTFYRALRERWSGPTAALDRVIERGGYGEELTLLRQPAEHLAGVPDGTIDVAMSTSVLEHVFDPPSVCQELSRITRLGGYNFHQIDFRWHRVAFARPLDFLLHSERRFRRDFEGDHGDSGNRSRASEMAALFRSAGFDLVRYTPNLLAEPKELSRVLSILRRSPSPYRNWPEEDVGILAAFFELRRTDDPAVRRHGDAELAAQCELKASAVAAAR